MEHGDGDGAESENHDVPRLTDPLLERRSGAAEYLHGSLLLCHSQGEEERNPLPRNRFPPELGRLRRLDGRDRNQNQNLSLLEF